MGTVIIILAVVFGLAVLALTMFVLGCARLAKPNEQRAYANAILHAVETRSLYEMSQREWRV